LKGKWVNFFELLVAAGISVGFIYLFYRIVGFEKLVKFFTELNPLNLIIAFLLYVFSYITRTLRWQITLSIKNFRKLFKITSFNTVFNIFLPFRTGELSFFYMLKKENIPLTETTLSFFSVRTFKGILHIIKKEKVKEFKENILTLRNIFSLYILSILTFTFKFTGFFFVLPEEINLSFLEAFIASSAGDLTTILPIHGIAGIGTYEGGYAGILIFMGIDKELALISSVFVHIFILLGSATLGLFSYIFLRR